MKSWAKTRNFWLAAALVSSGLVVLKLWFSPVQKPLPPSYAFPASVPLSRWQFVQATPLGQQKLYTPSLETTVDNFMISGQHYRYLRNGQPISIEMRYFRGYYSSASNLIQESTVRLEPVQLTPARSSVGAYATYQRSRQLFITGCISAPGETTFTDGQLRAALNRFDVLARRVLPWFLGQAPLRDMRCLWVTMSTPINSATGPEELEQAWVEWVRWWQNHYPPEP